MKMNGSFQLKHLLVFVFILQIVFKYNVHGAVKNELDCKCGRKQFACAPTLHVPCTCIPIEWKCDSDNDCGNQSDELDCVKPICPPEYFRCSKDLKCILNEWVCDNKRDCDDGSDELKCPSNPTSCVDESELTCKSGECINETWWCDGDADCSDNSDEEQCVQPTCKPTDFVCENKECIIAEWRCDIDFDCTDGSDEVGCDDKSELVTVVIASNATCRSDEFMCKGRYRECILLAYKCDGDQDCPDNSDEKYCNNTCSMEDFRCKDGQCIPLTYRCDKSEDCHDGSDELECAERETLICMENEFRCTSNLCISEAWRCDGDQDCGDNSDEVNCSACGRDQFKCKASLRCIRLSWRCDGEVDCMDKSDEMFCDRCEENQYKCSDGQCIGTHKLCDGHVDCFDRSDEPPVRMCDNVMDSNVTKKLCHNGNGGCRHICTNTVSGPVCSCNKGHQLGEDGVSCVDIDECAIESSCSHLCVNSNGSYTCSCLYGYALRRDGRTCKASGPEPSLLFANRIDIRKMQPERHELKPVLQNLKNAIALDYHINRELMFWSDVTLDSIKCSFMNGSAVREVVSVGLESPVGIAVDWIHDLLYWTDSGTSKIEVSSLNGDMRKVLIWQELEKPRAIALHPLKSLMFWTDWGVVPRVESAWMDGTGRRTIAYTQLYWPNGLTIDYTRDHVYWVDAKHHVIERADLDGQNRQAVISRGLPHPFAITIFEDKLYWTDWETKSISSANKFTGSSRHTIRNHLHFPMGIKTYHPLRQPEGENNCSHSRCSHLCLPKPEGFTCVCKTGFRKINFTHCAEEIDEFLIFARKSDIRRISFDSNELSDTVVPLRDINSAVALDWDNDYVYWSDVQLDTINRARWDGSQQRKIIDASLDSPAGLSIDWFTNKIYWTDAGLNRIEVALVGGALRSVLIWENLDRPRDILVFPENGLLYWTDWGRQPKIECASMDGSNRHAIVKNMLKWPNGLALDEEDLRIYWTDAGQSTIESCRLDGSDRQLVLKKNLPHPFGLTMHKGRVYWTDWTLNSIQSVNKHTGGDRKIIRENLDYLMDIQYYHKNRKITNNPCKERNGNCSHLCLLAHPVGALQTTEILPSPSMSCACPTGYALSSDRKTCSTQMTKFVVVARRTDMRLISLDVPYPADVKLDVTAEMVNVIAVDVDAVNEYIYWSDVGLSLISRSPLATPEHSEIVINDGLGAADGIAIDEYERKLYWTDARRKLIAVSELDGKLQKVLVYEDVDSPRAIALHHEIGYLYWTDWGVTAKIERMGMDGTNRSVIVNTDIVWPNGLAIDHDENLLFWADAHTQVIEFSDMTGKHRKKLPITVQHPYSMSVLAGLLYWTDWQTRNVEVVNLQNYTEQFTMRHNLPNLMGLKAATVNKSLIMERTNKYGKCRKGNKCSHLCLRSPTTESGFRCACTTGILLAADGRSCNEQPENYLLFTSRNSIRRLALDSDKNVYVQLPVTQLQNVIALDYHYELQKIFFTDVYLDVIRSAEIDGTDTHTLIESNLRTMDGIAVDWIANHLYWTDTGPNVISVAKLDGSKRKVIIDEQLDEPRAIVVSPTKGKIFWTDWGAKARIESAYMDGSSRKVLISKEIVWPNGLTLDGEGEGRLFWVDAHSSLRRIESCDLLGRHRTVQASHVSHGFAITYINHKLYWTDWQTHSISVATESSSFKNHSVLIKDIDGLMDIKAVSASHQKGTNACDARKKYGGCTDLCLMQGVKSFTCVTADVFNSTISTIGIVPTSSKRPTLTSISKNTVTQPTQSSLTTSRNMNGGETPTSNGSEILALLIGAMIFAAALGILIGVIVWRHLNKKKLRQQIVLTLGYRNGASQDTLLTSIENVEHRGNLTQSPIPESKKPLLNPSPDEEIEDVTDQISQLSASLDNLSNCSDAVPQEDEFSDSEVNEKENCVCNDSAGNQNSGELDSYVSYRVPSSDDLKSGEELDRDSLNVTIISSDNEK